MKEKKEKERVLKGKRGIFERKSQCREKNMRGGAWK